MSPESFVISPDPAVHQEIGTALDETPGAGPLWTLAEYPGASELARIFAERLRDGGGPASTGCIVFLDFSDPVSAKAVAIELDNNYPRAATIAVQSASAPHDLMELMQLGIRDLLTLPVSASDMVRALDRARRKLEHGGGAGESTGRIFAFVPAKPGTGATTIAMHSAAAAARLSRQPTLLIDFDLQLGMTSFLLQLHGSHSVLDALRLSGQLDVVWDRLICHRDMLDILGSAPVEFEREIPEGSAVKVLDFAKRQYQTVCVDLPGEMRGHEVDTLKCANEIFLVCTPDIGTLHMAKRKKDLLMQLAVQPRVSVILTRAQGRATVSVGQVESILELPVRFTVAAADKEIAEATQEAQVIAGHSTFATQMENIARKMIPGESKPASETKRSRFIEMFSVTPVRDKVKK